MFCVINFSIWLKIAHVEMLQWIQAVKDAGPNHSYTALERKTCLGAALRAAFQVRSPAIAGGVTLLIEQ